MRNRHSTSCCAQHCCCSFVYETSECMLSPLQCCDQGLVGKLPDFGLDIAAKMSVLRIDNTSLQQCNATSLAVYKDGLRDTTLRVDSSKADNTTGCLLDALVFCEDKSPVDETLECPSLAFRRPAEATPDQLDLVSSPCYTTCVGQNIFTLW